MVAAAGIALKVSGHSDKAWYTTTISLSHNQFHFTIFTIHVFTKGMFRLSVQGLQLVLISGVNSGLSRSIDHVLDSLSTSLIQSTRLVIAVNQETERLVADPAPGITASPHDDNLRYFDVTIEGPGGSPFEGACYNQLAVLQEC